MDKQWSQIRGIIDNVKGQTTFPIFIDFLSFLSSNVTEACGKIRGPLSRVWEKRYGKKDRYFHSLLIYLRNSSLLFHELLRKWTNGGHKFPV